MTLKVYLDMCALKRPFDDMRDERTRLEALATAAILEAHREGRIAAVSSAVLLAENARNPNLPRRRAVATILTAMDAHLVLVDDRVIECARMLESGGVRPLDALHVACAEAGHCDYLITTDDRMLRALRRAASHLRVRPVDPLEFIRILEGIAS